MKLVKKILLGLAGLFLIIIVATPLVINALFFQLESWETPAKIQSNRSVGEVPNILMLIAEDMSDRVGAFGDPVAVTPNIDRLASEGVRYPNTFTTAGVCSPSRAAFITGMHQIAMGGQHMRTATRPEGAYMAVPPAHMKAFPELLRKAGYYTFNTAKLDYQFSGAFPGSGPFTIWDAEDDPDLWRNRDLDQPFFGVMNLMETHETGLFSPLGTKPNSLMHFAIQLTLAFGGREKGDVVDSKQIEIPPYFPDNNVIRKDIAQHYQNINGMDRLVGKVLDRLEADGLLESTIVIWTTDHGDCLPRGKRELYDTGIKVPMVIRWPESFRPDGVKPGEIDERLISFVDFAPTFMELANAPKPDYFHGSSFASSSDSSRNYIYASRDRIDEVNDRQRAVRDDHYKYIRSWYPDQPGGHHIAFRDNLDIMKELWRLKEAGELTQKQLLWFESPGKERLFDVINDPFELNDLSNDSSHLPALNRLRDEMDMWLTKVGDWSDVSENEMVEDFQPNGVQEITTNPTIEINNKWVTITAPDNASIGYRIDESNWELYQAPFEYTGTKITAKAVRYGWKESEEVSMN